MSCLSRAPSTVPGVLTGICSTGICAHFTVESIEAQSGHMWPGQGGTDWTALPRDASSSVQALDRDTGYLYISEGAMEVKA